MRRGRRTGTTAGALPMQFRALAPVTDVADFNGTVLDANDDSRLDVRTVSHPDGAVTTFIGDGDGGFITAPVAVDDTITATATLPVRR